MGICQSQLNIGQMGFQQRIWPIMWLYKKVFLVEEETLALEMKDLMGMGRQVTLAGKLSNQKQNQNKMIETTLLLFATKLSLESLSFSTNDW